MACLDIKGAISDRDFNRELVAEYRIRRTGDAWGDCMGFFFPLATYIHFEREECPSEWQFRPGAFQSGLCEEDSEYAEIFADIPTYDLVAFGNKLHRLSEILRAAGKDY